MTLTSQNYFTDEQRREIADAVRRAELKTSAEIVPVLATTSDVYERGRFLAALAGGAIATGALVLVFCLPLEHIWPANWPLPHPWAVPAHWLLPVQILGLLAGYHLTSVLPGWHRAFIPRAFLHRQVDWAALAAFHRFELSHTQGATGVLLYVSLFERMMVVLADRAINEKHDQATWVGVRDLLGQGLTDRDHHGFIAAIERCGDLLAKDFPRQADDVDELPNEMRLM